MKTSEIRTLCSELEHGMKERLETLAAENRDVLQRLVKSREAVRKAIEELKAYVHQYKFGGIAEEIQFFKEIKPVIMSQYHYYDKLVCVKVNEPSGDREVLKAYYHSVLKDLQSYRVVHKDFLAYCLSGATDLDDVYFLRRNQLLADPTVDSQFSTGYDEILARLLSNRLVTEHVDGQIARLDAGTTASPLTWTTKKAYLVELVYALHEAQVFNEGRAGIKEIAALFENQFNTSLGNYYRHFAEITVRKTNRTNFLDLLKAKLTKRLDEADY